MLYGAIIGGIAGSRFEFAPAPEKNFELFDLSDSFTDDSILTIAIYEAVKFIKEHNITLDSRIREVFRSKLQYYGKLYPCPKGGYGSMFLSWLERNSDKPYNSCGNGSAMRVSSIGWLYDTLEETEYMAELSAAVTHNHPEGMKGAKAIAGAIFLARTGHAKKDIKKYIENLGYTIVTCKHISSRFEPKCQETVPICISAFLEGNSYEDVIRTVISIGGDTDTNGCIAGSVAEAFYGIPQELINRCDVYLDEKLLKIVKEANQM